MRRYKNKFQTIISNQSIINNDNNLEVKSISRSSNDGIKEKTLGYITISYATNISSSNNSTILDKSKNDNDLDAVDNDGNDNSLNYTDLVYIDTKSNGESVIHEVGNSEILFDSMFDYIIRDSIFRDSNLDIATIKINGDQ